MDQRQALDLAREALRQGNREAGRKALVEVLRADPHNETAWLWLSAIIGDPTKERECLERVLAINPNNGTARRHLARLYPSGIPVSQPESMTEQPNPHKPDRYRVGRPIYSGDIFCVVAAAVAVFSVSLAPWPYFTSIYVSMILARGTETFLGGLGTRLWLSVYTNGTCIWLPIVLFTVLLLMLTLVSGRLRAKALPWLWLFCGAVGTALSLAYLDLTLFVLGLMDREESIFQAWGGSRQSSPTQPLPSQRSP